MSSSSRVELLLKLEERLVSAVKVSASSSGTPMSVGAMIGDPGVWTSSSIGRGSRGGLVRYETSCRLLSCIAAVSKASDLSDSGDRTGDLGEHDEAWQGAGTATGFAGSWLSSGLGCLTSTGLVGVAELVGTDEPGEPL